MARKTTRGEDFPMKKLICAFLAAALAFGLAACVDTGPGGRPAETAVPAAGEADDTAEADDGFVTLRIAASPTPHAEILAKAAEMLQPQGIKLDIVEYTDYVEPNLATESGEVDANYFQHGAYLDSFNAQNGTHLVGVAPIHYEPMGLYAGQTASIEELPVGARIAIPDDAANGARALQLLAAQGLITLSEGAGAEATAEDIVDDPLGLELVPTEASQLARALDEADMAVINGNYAIEAWLSTDDAVALEAVDDDLLANYANLLVVKEGNENLPGLAELVMVLQSREMRDFIAETFSGSVVGIA